MKDKCLECGIDVKTNHSLRATGASTMFQSSVWEKIIPTTTGHGSWDALHTYEKTSFQQHQAVSKVQMSTQLTSYEDQMGQKQQTVQSTPPATAVSSVFHNLTNCTIGNITINLNPATSSRQTTEEEKFEELLSSMYRFGFLTELS